MLSNAIYDKRYDDRQGVIKQAEIFKKNCEKTKEAMRSVYKSAYESVLNPEDYKKFREEVLHSEPLNPNRNFIPLTSAIHKPPILPIGDLDDDYEYDDDDDD